MPPFLPRNRLRSPTPEAGPSQAPTKGKSKDKAGPISVTPRKPTLFDDIDAGISTKRNTAHTKAALEKMAAEDEDDSSLSSFSDEDFDGLPSGSKRKTSHDSEGEDEDDDEEMEFEDVLTPLTAAPSGPAPSGDLELTLTKNPARWNVEDYGGKKGPSKIARGIRIATHQAHVVFLMWANAYRNSWLCDKELQEILVKALPPNVALKVGIWKRDSGLLNQTEATSKGKGKAKVKNEKGKKTNVRNQRDWGQPAERLEEGQVNMSAGDPLFKLLKLLANYWRQRFRITAPGLRKTGYMSAQRLEEEVKSFKNDEHNPEKHGERFMNIEEFRDCAKRMEGSRDVGAQLFTALLRGMGIEARMVASLQPVGFGWNKNEEALEKNPRVLKGKTPGLKEDTSESEEDTDDETEPAPPTAPKRKGKAPGKAKKAVKTPAMKSKKISRRRSQADGSKDIPIDLSEAEDSAPDGDDESVIDVTPAKKRTLASLPYDKDLLYPHYWTEVLSPITNTYTPVDPMVLHIIGTSKELIEKFEPRGAKSEKVKQVTSYVIGHSPDGTAKDVTTRYLKAHMWPGRTKGNRWPKEKIAIRNRHGKVKRYEERDWFKTVMSPYLRGSSKCPRTEIDDYEEETDLKPAVREKKEVEEGKETLQYYKSSAEFCLERHLKREEALLPTAKHVKMFIVKGKGEATTEEKVYLRKDVVHCKSMETWHKEGRAPKDGEEPLKRVPYRAATTNRRRELAEAEQAAGEKVLQGLYSEDQTDWIIPPPIENGIIPKNNFGNIDLYVDSMLPEGAAHIPMRGTVKICKRLGIDYAEAVTGFEFGHKMAVPVITGVVVAEEYEETIMEEWRKDEAERVRKEDEKRERAALAMWRKMLMGMRIVERLKAAYGDDNVDLNPFAQKEETTAEDEDIDEKKRIMDEKDEEMGGGFLPEGFEMEEPIGEHSNFFPVSNGEEDRNSDHGGGFILEGHDEEPKTIAKQGYPTPQSLGSSSKTDAERESLDEGEEMEDVATEEEATPPKRRGRPAGSSNKTPKAKATPKARAPAKRAAPKTETPTLRKRGRPNKVKVEEPEEEEEDEQSSSASEPASSIQEDDDEGEEEPAPKRAKTERRGGRRATLPPKTATTPRAVPKRRAARKSETALRSHYFEHSDDGEDD